MMPPRNQIVPRLLLTLLVCVATSFLGGSSSGLITNAYASEQSEDRSVLQRSTDSSWYSADKDELVAVVPFSRESIDVSDRDKSVKAPEVTTPKQGNGFSNIIGDFFQFIVGAWLYIVLIIVLLIIGFVLAYVIMNLQGPTGFRRRQEFGASTAERDQAKITDLPFEIEQSNLGLLEQASLFRSRGEYSKAIVYLFSHVLVELDAAGHIRLARGKTNRIYLRELGSRETERKFTSYLVRWFEHVFFGKHDMDPEVFEKIWGQLPAFDRQLKSIVGENNHA
ncbi:MAG: hypothetical protein ACK56W_22400 [Pirellula sp.]|jgi:hypothetical protein|nr:hypothetical protein [Pirellula sp.]